MASVRARPWRTNVRRWGSMRNWKARRVAKGYSGEGEGRGMGLEVGEGVGVRQSGMPGRCRELGFWVGT